MRYLLLILTITTINSFAQKGKIKGVVTYYFNQYQGDKSDIGAAVYIVDSAKCRSFDTEIPFQYELASIKNPKGDDAAFKSIDGMNALNNQQIINSEYVNTTTVDGSGNYSIDLPKGTYYILIQSKGRPGLSTSEVLGCIYYIKVRLNADQTKEVSHNFPLN